MFEDHSDIPSELYSKLKKNLESNYAEDKMSIATFMKDLPIDLRRPLSMYVYKEVHENVEFLSGRDVKFISWICPLLKTRVAGPNESIYYENDYVQSIFFLKNGACNYVLPKYSNTPFLRIVEHTLFGIADFITALLAIPGNKIKTHGIMSVFDCDHDHNHDLSIAADKSNCMG